MLIYGHILAVAIHLKYIFFYLNCSQDSTEQFYDLSIKSSKKLKQSFLYLYAFNYHFLFFFMKLCLILNAGIGVCAVSQAVQTQTLILYICKLTFFTFSHDFVIFSFLFSSLCPSRNERVFPNQHHETLSS